MILLSSKTDVGTEFSKYFHEILNSYEEFLSKVEQASDEDKDYTMQKTFQIIYEATNAFRNQTKGLINKAESTLKEEYKKGPFSNNSVIKKVIFEEYTEQKKSFFQVDDKLRKMFPESLERASKKEL